MFCLISEKGWEGSFPQSNTKMQVYWKDGVQVTIVFSGLFLGKNCCLEWEVSCLSPTIRPTPLTVLKKTIDKNNNQGLDTLMSAGACPPPAPPSVWCWGPDSGHSAWSGETKSAEDLGTIAWNGECAPLAGPLRAFAAGSAAKFGWAASSSRAFWKIGVQNKERIRLCFEIMSQRCTVRL